MCAFSKIYLFNWSIHVMNAFFSSCRFFGRILLFTLFQFIVAGIESILRVSYGALHHLHSNIMNLRFGRGSSRVREFLWSAVSVSPPSLTLATPLNRVKCTLFGVCQSQSNNYRRDAIRLHNGVCEVRICVKFAEKLLIILERFQLPWSLKPHTITTIKCIIGLHGTAIGHNLTVESFSLSNLFDTRYE